jgi:predicted nuclease of predicted toxin-antitoxin system
MGRMYADE